MTDNVKTALGKLSRRLKIVIPPTRNIAQELALLLNVSIEGAYRRLRGETNFNLKELLLIQERLGISLDELNTPEQFSNFYFQPLQEHAESLASYLHNWKDRFLHLMLADNSLTITICHQLPLFKFFGHPHLAQFKLHQIHTFVERRTTRPVPYEPQYWMKELTPVIDRLHETHQATSSIEIWSAHSTSYLLQDIGSYLRANCLNAGEAARMIFELYTIIRKTCKDAIHEQKAHRSADSDNYFAMYLHDGYLSNNSITIETDEYSHLAYEFNHYNMIHTSNCKVIREHKQWINHLIDTSVPINSQSSERVERFVSEQLELLIRFTREHLPEDIASALSARLHAL